MAKAAETIANAAAETTTSVNTLVGVRRTEFLKSLGIMASHAARQPKPFARHLSNYGKELLNIAKGTSELAPHRKDRRFKDETWHKNPLYKRGLQAWLAMRKELNGWVEDSGLEAADQSRIKFLLDMIIDSLAPTNTLLGNPAAMKKLYETGGQSLIKGLKNAYNDVRYNGGMPSQVDGRPFKIGENIATSKGAVVYKTEMLELIQYQPLTEQVYKIPLMVIPPQINKFYANDLSPNKSIIRFLTSMGFQVFAVSWRNPSRQHSHWGLEAYVDELIMASDAVQKITRSKRINVTGACSGGITMAHMLSELAARDDNRVNCYTLMVSVLDSKKSDSEVGHDLIWNYVVNNYLLGEDPPPFDVLFWNSDTTNLPAQLHSDYMDIFLDKRFRREKDIEFMGNTVDLSRVVQDGFMVAGVTDHITPWKACYRNAHLFGGDIDFVLSNSGHIQSLLNPPGNPKAQYFINKDLPVSADDWVNGAESIDASWWTRWAEWLSERSGERKAAPKKLGNKAYAPVAQAPGEYVFT